MTRPAGKVTCILSLEVLYASAIKEYRRENTILFQTLVSGAVIKIRPTTSSIGDRKGLRADLFQQPVGAVGHRRDLGGLDGAFFGEE